MTSTDLTATDHLTATGLAATTVPRIRRGRRVLRTLGRELLGGLWPLLVIIAIWEVAYLALPRNSFLQAPTDVARFMADGHHAKALLSASWSTALMLLLGYVIAVAIAVLLSAAVVSSRVLARAIMPLAVLLGVLPVIVVTPVIIMLVGRNPGTSVTVCVMITFFPALLNIVAGMRSTSRTMLDLGRVLGGSRWRILLSVRLPQSVPGIISASKLALPAALTGVILTEYIATGRGIGTYINEARANFLYVDMWAGITTVVILSVLVYTVLGSVEIVLSERYVASGRGGRRS